MFIRGRKLWLTALVSTVSVLIVAAGITATAQTDKQPAQAQKKPAKAGAKPVADEEKPEPKKTTRQTLMEGKMGISQDLLRGLVLRDFEQIKTSATALNVLTLGEEWFFNNTKEYARMSEDLRRTSRDLVRAARSKDLSGATLAYQRMTYSCVECHQALKDGFENATE